MNLVVDSSALIALARIGQLDLLHQLAKTIHVPEGVYEEVANQGTLRPGTSELGQFNWILRKRVSDQASVNDLLSRFGRGEAEAIVLAAEVQADFVILDDATARSVAEQKGQAVVGTLGLLVHAKERGLIERVEPIMNELMESGFYVDSRLYGTILQQAGEEPQA